MSTLRGLPTARTTAYLLTYLCLVPLLGHRPPTRVLQLSPSSVGRFFSSRLQVSPNLLMSASKSRLHEFLGRPLFLFPWGFQDRACRTTANAHKWPKVRNSSTIQIAVFVELYDIKVSRFVVSVVLVAAVVVVLDVSTYALAFSIASCKP